MGKGNKQQNIGDICKTWNLTSLVQFERKC